MGWKYDSVTNMLLTSGLLSLIPSYKLIHRVRKKGATLFSTITMVIFDRL